MIPVLNQRVCSHASLGSTCYIFHAVSDGTGEPEKLCFAFYRFFCAWNQFVYNKNTLYLISL
jgi:hypothetical protein